MPMPAHIAANAGHAYIDGAWAAPKGARPLDVIDPATEEPVAQIALGDERDVDAAVRAARKAFASFSQTSREERLALLEKIADVYARRAEDIAQAVTHEMGAPITLARQAQAAAGLGHLKRVIEVLRRLRVR